MSTLSDHSSVIGVVDTLCDRFEDALKAGEWPPLDAWLNEAGTASGAALPDLIDLDLDYRIRAGETITAADYFVRFPELLKDPNIAVRLVATEFRVSRTRKPGLSEADFRRRYRDLAEHPDWSYGPWISKPLSNRTSTEVRQAETTAEFRPARTDPAEFLATILAPSERPNDLGRLGDYRILGILGTGAMGVVLKAEDPTLGRTIAIKLMRPEIAAKPGARERFLREARAAAAVEHPRVVVIHHVGEWNGTPFLVMPLMAGRSLRSRLKDGPPITILETVQIAREAADGLVAAHTRGLTHRDIKPDNIWLEDTAEGTHVRLLDFGLARDAEAETLTEPGLVVGTPSYMAPEQAAGRPLDGRTDLFSLGCVLFEMSTGQRAFVGSTVLSVLHALVNHNPPELQELVPAVPASLSDLTRQLLEKSPEHRPRSASVVSSELRRIEQKLGDQTETAILEVMRPNPARSRLPRWAWVLSTMFLVGLVVLICRAVTQDRTLVADTIVPSKTEPITIPSSTLPLPLRVTAIEVSHFAHTLEGDVPKGLLGEKTFTPAQGDRVQVMAKLSKPGYAYLIVFRPDGVAELCFPIDEDTPPSLTDTPRYPLTNGLKSYGLREGTGLWVFAVVASEKPLPSYRSWQQLRFGSTSPWTPLAKLPAGFVWRDDGDTIVDTFTASGVTHILRGKDEELEGPATTIKRLTDVLRTTGQVDTASAIGFAVTGSKD